MRRRSSGITAGLVALLAAAACGSGSTTPVGAAGQPAVTVEPSAVETSPAATVTFAAQVTGAPSTQFTWSVQEGSAGGSITADGSYTAPTVAGTYHVVATSVTDSSMKGVSTVTVAVAPARGTGLTYPPDVALVAVPMPSFSIPPYLVPVTDPTFGTTIVRIGNEGTGASSMRHHYAKDQPWNADGTLVKLNPGATMPILDGGTYAFIKNISAPSNDNVWSNVDPNTIYGGHGNSLVSIDVATGTWTTLHDFGVEGYSSIYIGDNEGNFSNDDHYACLIGQRGGTAWVISWDNVGKSILAAMDTGASSIDNCTVSQSGAYVVVNGASGQGTRSYRTSDLSFVAQLSSNRNHFDVCYDAPGGNEVIVKEDNGYPVIGIATGTLLRQAIPGLTTPQSHISCRNLQRPGWAYVSPEGVSSNSGTIPWQRLLAVKLDGSGLVEDFAHAHHEVGTSPYDGAPMVVPNRTGDRVMWKVAWDGSGSVYSYVAWQP